MSALRTLGRMLGLACEPDYDILKNERAARIALSRRDFLAAGAALSVGRVMVFGADLEGWELSEWSEGAPWDDMTAMLKVMSQATHAVAKAHGSQGKTQARSVRVVTSEAFAQWTKIPIP